MFGSLCVCGVAADIVRATKPADTLGPPWQDDKFIVFDKEHSPSLFIVSLTYPSTSIVFPISNFS